MTENELKIAILTGLIKVKPALEITAYTSIDDLVPLLESGNTELYSAEQVSQIVVGILKNLGKI